MSLGANLLSIFVPSYFLTVTNIYNNIKFQNTFSLLRVISGKTNCNRNHWIWGSMMRILA